MRIPINTPRPRTGSRLLQPAFALLGISLSTFFATPIRGGELLSKPSTLPATPLQSPTAASIIGIPVRISLARISAEVDAQTLRAIDEMEEFTEDESGRLGIKYMLARDPIRLRFEGGRLKASALMRYGIVGCTRVRVPLTGEERYFPCIECGVDDEPMRQVRVGLESTLEWSADWRLISKTIALPPLFLNRCRVTMLGLDITDKVIAPEISSQLQIAARSIDRSIAGAKDVRKAAEIVWSLLQAPINVRPDLWLQLNPTAIALGPLEAAAESLSTTLHLQARPALVTSPPGSAKARPLPPLRVVAPSSGALSIPIDAQLSWAEANRLVIANAQLPRTGSLRIESIELQPGEKGKLRVVAMVDYSESTLKKFRGRVLLDGTPAYDRQTGYLVLENLQYQLDSSSSLFVKIANRLAYQSIRTRLAAACRWYIQPRIEQMRADVERSLQRQIAPGVLLGGKLTALTPLGVVVDRESITIRVNATGTLAVTIR